jgi:TonB family protein
MNRLEQKCVVASAGLHLLLVAILFIGPAFLAPKSQPENMPVLDFIPFKTVDALIPPGGGRPDGRVPEPPPPAPPARQVTPPARDPAPLPEPPKPAPRDVVSHDAPDSSLIPSTKPKLADVNLIRVKRPTPSHSDTTAREDEKARERADAQRRKTADLFGKAAVNIGNNVSSGVSMELKGIGGGGVPYANFRQAVMSAYENAWVLPDGVADDDATAMASVTIARDGTVREHHISRSSGNAAIDQSVRATLDRVTWVAPLPDDAKEKERTVSISFNAHAKKALQ